MSSGSQDRPPALPGRRSSNNGTSAELQKAIQESDVQAVERLLKGGANPNVLPDGSAPLHKAVMRSVDAAIVRLLIQYKAIVDEKRKPGETPLHVAIKEANLPAVRSLIDGSAEIELTNYATETPLYVAA